MVRVGKLAIQAITCPASGADFAAAGVQIRETFLVPRWAEKHRDLRYASPDSLR
jgi:hypothetical protein